MWEAVSKLEDACVMDQEDKDISPQAVQNELELDSGQKSTIRKSRMTGWINPVDHVSKEKRLNPKLGM